MEELIARGTHGNRRSWPGDKRPDVTLPKGAQKFDSGYLNPSQSYEHTFRTPGTYQYVCTLHEVQRMIGQIIVKP